MSTIKSSSEDLTLNADGLGKDIKFQSNGVEKASLTDAGVFTATSFAGSGASLTNLPAHSGNVAFPATQVASADANTLDDYEEGTFTATISDGTNDATMSASAGVYTKIGRMVQAEIQIAVSSMGSVSGAVRIKGLPFNSANDGVYPGMAWGYGSSLNLGAAGYGVNGFINPNTNYISLYTHDQTTGCTSLQGTEWTVGGQIFATINYHV